MADPDVVLMKAIQEKYVGTSAEHDLIRRIIENGQETWDDVEQRFNDFVEHQREQLRRQETALSDVAMGRVIDLALMDYLRNLPDEGEFWIRELAVCLRGRGCDAELLIRLAGIRQSFDTDPDSVDDPLPVDFAEAVEQFKLALARQHAGKWDQVRPSTIRLVLAKLAMAIN